MEMAKKLIVLILAVSVSGIAHATGPYNAKIKNLQISSTGNAYHTVWLHLDVTNSPCSGTNSIDRFVITSEEQLSLLLAAAFSQPSKPVSLYGTGTCAGPNERIAEVRVAIPN